MTNAPIRTFDQPEIDLNGKSILVTGGTGSFGQAFVRTVAGRYRPRKLIVFSRDEMKQSEMARAYPPDRLPFMRYFIGDVRDRDRLVMALRDVDYVVHAAALKQIPVAEYNPFECIHTNVIGAENIVQAAIQNGVGRVIALSTDKASNPHNLYGASKLAADKIFMAAGSLSGDQGTIFSVVRYGNVLDSRGSVVPLFKRLIAEGAESLPITDPRMTRFWITLRQGVDFLLSCLAMMRGSEMFVPKIPSMKVIDVARSLAPDLPLDTIGIRPGEKLHEVLVGENDGRQTYEIDDRYVIGPSSTAWDPEPLLAAGARPVGDGFRYASDTNPEWIDSETLHRLLSDGTP